MKHRLLFLLVIIITFSFSNCKKDKPEDEPSPISTFSKLLGYTAYNNGFEYYDFIVEEDKSVVVAYNVTTSTEMAGLNTEDMVIHLEKFNERGESVWKKKFLTEYYGWIYHVAKSNDGGYLMTGAIADSEFEYWNNTAVYLIKTDAEGNKLWTKTYGPGEGGFGIQVIQKENDDILILAQELSALVYHLDSEGNLIREIPMPFGHEMIIAGDGDIVVSGVGVAKVNENGDMNWAVTFPFIDEEPISILKSVTNTDDGGYIAFGYRKFFKEVGGYNDSIDYLMVKISPAGTFEWEKTFHDLDRGYGDDVSVTAEGNYIAIGVSEGGSSTISGNLKAYLVDPLGNLIWDKNIRFTVEDYAYPCTIKQIEENHYGVMGVTIVNQPPQFSTEVRIKKFRQE